MPRLLRSMLGSGLALAAFAQAGCSLADDHRVGGKTVDEVFANSKLVALSRSSCDGDLAGVSRAIKDGANPNGRGLRGSTPLFWAMSCHSVPGVESLLKAGADPNYRISGEFSATYAAATFDDPTMLKLLLKYGGDPNSTSELSHQSALWEALTKGVDSGNWANWEVLLDAGADINGLRIAEDAAALNQYNRVVELLDRGYNCDLEHLGRIVETGEVNVPSAQFSRTRVVQMLEEQGVRFPIAPGKGMPVSCGRHTRTQKNPP